MLFQCLNQHTWQQHAATLFEHLQLTLNLAIGQIWIDAFYIIIYIYIILLYFHSFSMTCALHCFTCSNSGLQSLEVVGGSELAPLFAPKAEPWLQNVIHDDKCRSVWSSKWPKRKDRIRSCRWILTFVKMGSNECISWKASPSVEWLLHRHAHWMRTWLSVSSFRSCHNTYTLKRLIWRKHGLKSVFFLSFYNFSLFLPVFLWFPSFLPVLLCTSDIRRPLRRPCRELE